METTTVIDALSALAHESRLGKLPNANASFHLKELAHAGLIHSVQSGRFIYYAANYKTMNGLVEYLTRNCCQGSACDIACAPVLKRKKKG